MKWSPQQDQALSDVAAWLADEHRKPFFYLAGYAGAGKSTLAKHFAEGVDGRVIYAAFTGKAAYVLTQKGCAGACTIHSLIYHPKEKCRVKLAQLNKEIAHLAEQINNLAGSDSSLELDASDAAQYDRLRSTMRELAAKRKAESANLARPLFTLNTESEITEASLVILDECSMIDEHIGADILSFGVPILVLGDPAQLPPVGNAGYFTGREPDFMLTEIHRQAHDNPIIRLATLVRSGEGLPGYGSYGESQIVRSGSVASEQALEFDQFLCGRNVTRHGANTRYRQLRKFEGQYPVVGDRLVCLRNNHELGLLNGSLWTTLECDDLDDERLLLSVENDEGAVVDCQAHTAHFLGTETTDLAWYERKEAEEFDFGYALTVHKAQGSQWDNVLLKDESSCFRADARRHLYTAVTRAAERITIIR